MTLLFPIAYFQQHLSFVAYAGSILGFLKCPQITVRQTDGFPQIALTLIFYLSVSNGFSTTCTNTKCAVKEYVYTTLF